MSDVDGDIAGWAIGESELDGAVEDVFGVKFWGFGHIFCGLVLLVYGEVGVTSGEDASFEFLEDFVALFLEFFGAFHFWLDDGFFEGPFFFHSLESFDFYFVEYVLLS